MTKPDRKISVLIADDHPIFRDSLKALLKTEPGLQVVGEAGNGDDTLKLVKQLRPDLLLLDLSMPKVTGMDVLQSLARSNSSVRTIILCATIEADQISQAFDLGARGLVMKDAATSMLLKSISSVMSGQYWMNCKSVKSLSRTLKKPKDSLANIRRSKNYGLTPREMEIIRAVTTGMRTREIAQQLSISEQTVKHHITSIFDKLGVYNRLELTLFAFHHKLIDPST